MKKLISLVAVTVMTFGILAQAETQTLSKDAVKGANLVRIPGIQSCLNEIEEKNGVRFSIETIEQNRQERSGKISGLLIRGGDMVAGRAIVAFEGEAGFPSVQYTCITSVTLF